jgi:hypothetical protein
VHATHQRADQSLNMTTEMGTLTKLLREVPPRARKKQFAEAQEKIKGIVLKKSLG